MLKIHFLFSLKISERVLPMVNAGNVTVLHSSVHRGKCLARRVTEPTWDSATMNLLKGHSTELTPDDFSLHQRSVHLTALIREASIGSSWWLRLPQPVNMQRREYSMLSPKWAIYIIPTTTTPPPGSGIMEGDGAGKSTKARRWLTAKKTSSGHAASHLTS